MAVKVTDTFEGYDADGVRFQRVIMQVGDHEVQLTTDEYGGFHSCVDRSIDVGHYSDHDSFLDWLHNTFGR